MEIDLIFHEEPYPQEIMEAVRESLGLSEDDTSKDAEITTMTKNDVLEKVMRASGVPGLSASLRIWVEMIYDVKLESQGDE